MAWAAVAAAGVGLVGGMVADKGSKRNDNVSTGQQYQKPVWADNIAGPLGLGVSQATDMFDFAGGRYFDPYSMYVAPNSNQTNSANTQAQYASNNGLSNAGLGNITDTLNGRYLDQSSNPWLANTFNMAANQVQGRVNSDFNKAGRYGSGLQSDTYQHNLNDLATQIYGGNYQQERNRQIQALGLAPSVAGLPFVNTQALMNAGNQQQAWEQQRINAPLDRLNTQSQFFRNQSPGQQISSSTSANTPYYTNPLNSALGFGLGAYGMMNRGGGGGGTNWWGGTDYGAGEQINPTGMAQYYGYE